MPPAGKSNDQRMPPGRFHRPDPKPPGFGFIFPQSTLGQAGAQPRRVTGGSKAPDSGTETVTRPRVARPVRSRCRGPTVNVRTRRSRSRLRGLHRPEIDVDPQVAEAASGCQSRFPIGKPAACPKNRSAARGENLPSSTLSISARHTRSLSKNRSLNPCAVSLVTSAHKRPPPSF